MTSRIVFVAAIVAMVGCSRHRETRPQVLSFNGVDDSIDCVWGDGGGMRCIANGSTIPAQYGVASGAPIPPPIDFVERHEPYLTEARMFGRVETGAWVTLFNHALPSGTYASIHAALDFHGPLPPRPFAEQTTLRLYVRAKSLPTGRIRFDIDDGQRPVETAEIALIPLQTTSILDLPGGWFMGATTDLAFRAVVSDPDTVTVQVQSPYRTWDYEANLNVMPLTE